jgi:uncharacterized protein involved in exopolysaccharide biosynthesis
MHLDENGDSTQSPVTNHQSPTLFDYLQVIAGQFRTILMITLAAALIAVIASLLMPNIYTAKTMVLPSQEDRNLMSALMNQMGGLASLAAGAGSQIGGPTTVDLYVSMLRSEAVKDPLIDRLRLMEVYHRKYRADVYAILDKKTSVSVGKKDGIITISVSDRDPRRAAALANAYVAELGNLAVRLSVSGAGQTRNFLEERLVKAKAELSKAEENLKAFQTKNKAVSVTAQAEATIKGVAELRAQLAVQEVQLATYRRQFTDSSQEVKNLVTSVANLRTQIAKLEGEGGDSALPSVGSVPTIGQEYVRLMREFKTQESLVELLTKQYEMARLSEAKDVSPLQIIQVAKVPERKSGPSRSKIIIMTVLAAFFFSIVGLMVREYLGRLPEHDVKRWKEIWNMLKFWKKPAI